jgi:hypothetical protein
MGQMSSEMGQQQQEKNQRRIELRKDKVPELSSQGHNQREIFQYSTNRKIYF